MARTITELTAATTPLAGTELAWIEQGGLPRKVAVSDIADAGSGVTLPASTGASNILRGDGAGGWVEETDLTVDASGNLSTTGTASAAGGGTLTTLGTLTQADNYALINRTSANPALYVVNASTGPGARIGVGTIGSTTYSDYVDIGEAGNHLTMVGTAPKLKWNETDGGTDAKIWDIVPVAGQMRFRLINDADASSLNWMTVDRTGFASAVLTTPSTTEITHSGTVDCRFGINGGYSSTGASTAWGATIWSLDTAFDGDTAGLNSANTSVYGIRWLRNTHANADAQVDEGLYGFINGVQYFAMGTDGAKFAGEIYPGNQTVGMIQAVSGSYGSVQCDGADGSSGTWGGWSISGRYVFMGHPTEQRCGIYDDVDNQWALQWNAENAASAEKLSLYSGASTVAARTQSIVAGVSSGLELYHPNAVYYDAGYNQMPRTITNASVTLSNEDAGGCFYSNNATNYTITLNNQTDFPVESCFFILNYGSGTVTVSQGTGSLLWPNGSANSGNRTVGAYSVATIFHYAAATWFIWGDDIS